MNRGIRAARELVVRSILRISAVMLFASVVCSVAPAQADDIVLRWNALATQTATATTPFNGSLPATVITEHYTQLKEIADDVDDARVYGGIHWRSDQVAGNVLGRGIATEVVKNNLRPVHP